jgi:hypothetical protein
MNELFTLQKLLSLPHIRLVPSPYLQPNVAVCSSIHICPTDWECGFVRGGSYVLGSWIISNNFWIRRWVYYWQIYHHEWRQWIKFPVSSVTIGSGDSAASLFTINGLMWWSLSCLDLFGFDSTLGVACCLDWLGLIRPEPTLFDEASYCRHDPWFTQQSIGGGSFTW